MAPFKFIDRVSRGAVLQQFGDGSSSRDDTYIDDIVDGVIRAVDRPYSYQIFNLGKGSGTPLKEFIGLVQKNVGKKANIQILPDQPGDVPYTCADVSKAERLLGYRSQVGSDPFCRSLFSTAHKTGYVCRYRAEGRRTPTNGFEFLQELEGPHLEVIFHRH